MRRQTEIAVAEADAIFFLVDARAGVTPTDRHFAQLVRRAGKPVILIANKAEGAKGEAGAMEAHELGLGDPVRLSAEHDEGFSDLYQTMLERLPAEFTRPAAEVEAERAPLVLGNGESMKITLISLGAFFPMALGAQAGCQNVPQAWREVGQALELSRWTTLRTIVLPAAGPSILAGMELSLNVAWLGTFGAEYLIGTGYINGMGDGLGAYLAAAREYARMDQVLLGVLFLGLVGVTLDRLVVGLSRKAFPWHNR